MSVSLDEVLARHNVGLTGEEFLAELDAGLSRVAHPTAAPLTATEVDFLRQHGGPVVAEVLAEDPDDLEREAARAVAGQMSELVQESLSFAEAALLLGVDRSRISQRVSHRSLWGFQLGRSKRLPRWQFTPDGLLPGLDVIVKAIPDGLLPASIAGFMTTPQDELDGLVPTDYLSTGGNPQAVAALLESLGQW